MTYSYGTKISFALGGNATRYQGKGWSAPESDGTWTEGGSATLVLTVPPSDAPIMFKATVSGFVKPPELPSQPVEVAINGSHVAHWEIAAKGLAQMPIPPTFLHDGKLEITFTMPKATSPAALGVSIDERKLGMHFVDLELAKP